MSATRSSQACYTRVTCTFNLLRLGQITEAQELLSGCYEVPCKAFEVVPAGLVLQLLTRRSLTVAKDRTLFSDPEGTIYRHGLLQDQLANVSETVVAARVGDTSARS